MARTNDRDRNPKRAPKETRPRGKRKVCVFCKEHAEWWTTRTSASPTLYERAWQDPFPASNRQLHAAQRDVQVAIKTARELALLPYVQRTASERGPGRPRTARAGRRARAGRGSGTSRGSELRHRGRDRT